MRMKVTRLLVAAGLAAGAMAFAVPQASATHLSQVKCSNGFTRTVPTVAAAGIVKALNAFNQYNQSGITCTFQPIPHTP